jgi:hypothetical protein
MNQVIIISASVRIVTNINITDDSLLQEVIKYFVILNYLHIKMFSLKQKLVPGIFLGSKVQPTHKAENQTAFCEPIV